MLDEYQRDEALLHFQRGVVLERANRVEEAVAEYRRAIARYPHLREAHDALGFYYQRYGLLAKAAEEFRVVANLEDDFLSHFNLGYVLLELQRHDDALEAFHRCLEIIPTDAATHYEVAYLRFLKGDYGSALAHAHVALQHYQEDWEIHKLLGRCMVRLGRYDEAANSFSNALTHAARPAVRAEIEAMLASVERYRECETTSTLKDRLYAEHGVVYLGSAQDYGTHLREVEEFHFTYPDIATTLLRFVRLVRDGQWHFTCVVPLDRLSRPIARALQAQLDLPVCSNEALGPNDRPLLVTAIGREAELLELARERAPKPTVDFCLGLNWMRLSQTLPDIMGVMVRGACSVPWEPELRRLRSVGAPSEQIDRCLNQAVEQIAAAIADLENHAALDQQIAYYTRDHRKLRFAPAIS